MTDWNYWINNSETREMIKILKEELSSLERTVIDGYMLKHDQADKIAVDYAHKVGAVEGFRHAISTIEELKESD